MSTYLFNIIKTNKTLAKEIEKKKKARIKENGSINVLGLVNKPSTKESKPKKTTNRPSKTNQNGERLP